MFDFERLTVYQRAKSFSIHVKHFLNSAPQVDRTTHYQLRRASHSILLNIAEGASRFSDAGRRNFYIISRGSAFECVAIFDEMKDDGLITVENFGQFYSELEELSKMLFAMIKKCEKGKG